MAERRQKTVFCLASHHGYFLLSAKLFFRSLALEIKANLNSQRTGKTQKVVVRWHHLVAVELNYAIDSDGTHQRKNKRGLQSAHPREQRPREVGLCLKI